MAPLLEIVGERGLEDQLQPRLLQEPSKARRRSTGGEGKEGKIERLEEGEVNEELGDIDDLVQVEVVFGAEERNWALRLQPLRQPDGGDLRLQLAAPSSQDDNFISLGNMGRPSTAPARMPLCQGGTGPGAG